jgi:hypothetical protein
MTAGVHVLEGSDSITRLLLSHWQCWLCYALVVNFKHVCILWFVDVVPLHLSSRVRSTAARDCSNNQCCSSINVQR